MDSDRTGGGGNQLNELMISPLINVATETSVNLSFDQHWLNFGGSKNEAATVTVRFFDSNGTEVAGTAEEVMRFEGNNNGQDAFQAALFDNSQSFEITDLHGAESINVTFSWSIGNTKSTSSSNSISTYCNIWFSK